MRTAATLLGLTVLCALAGTAEAESTSEALYRHSMALGDAQQDLLAFIGGRPRSADYVSAVDLLGVIHHARAIVAEVDDLQAVLDAVPCDRSAPASAVARLISGPLHKQLENDVNQTNVNLNQLSDAGAKDSAVRIRAELRAVLTLLDTTWPAP